MSCPHIWSSDEGTSYCELASVTAKQWQKMKGLLIQGSKLIRRLPIDPQAKQQILSPMGSIAGREDVLSEARDWLADVAKTLSTVQEGSDGQ